MKYFEMNDEGIKHLENLLDSFGDLVSYAISRDTALRDRVTKALNEGGILLMSYVPTAGHVEVCLGTETQEPETLFLTVPSGSQKAEGQGVAVN